MTPTPFAEALSKFRELAGLTQLQLAARSGTAHSSVNRWEKGGSLPKKDNAEALDKALAAEGQLMKAWRMVTTGHTLPEWARSLVAVEEAALTLSVASPVLVPGYLQCPEYASRVFTAGLPAAPAEEIKRLTRLRCGRLTDLSDLRVSSVFPMSALKGFPKDIAAAQANYLLDWAATGRVAIHLVPEGGILMVPTSPIMLFRLRNGELVMTSDHADGSVTLRPDAHERVSALFSASLAASLPTELSLDALKDLL